MRSKVAITPMNGSIRYGGTMEVGKINDQVNMNRVKGIVESVPKYFPNFKPEIPQQKDIWVWFRPVSPDGMPYIGLSAKYNNLGHCYRACDDWAKPWSGNGQTDQ